MRTKTNTHTCSRCLAPWTHARQPALNGFDETGRQKRLSYCQKCATVRKRRDRFKWEHLPHARETRQAYRADPAARQRRQASHANWCRSHPLKRRAQQRVQDARRNGKITPPNHCSITGCFRPVEAHHTDYAAPRAVTWLCRVHHARVHHGLFGSELPVPDPFGGSPQHPGVALGKLMLTKSLSARGLAEKIGVAMSRVVGIMQGKRSISPDTAARLARFFGNDATYWTSLQAAFDLAQVTRNTALNLHLENPAP